MHQLSCIRFVLYLFLSFFLSFFFFLFFIMNFVIFLLFVYLSTIVILYCWAYLSTALFITFDFMIKCLRTYRKVHHISHPTRTF